jgi:hypothetical protein
LSRKSGGIKGAALPGHGRQRIFICQQGKFTLTYKKDRLETYSSSL